MSACIIRLNNVPEKAHLVVKTVDIMELICGDKAHFVRPLGYIHTYQRGCKTVKLHIPHLRSAVG